MAKFCNKCGAPLIPGQPHICPRGAVRSPAVPPHWRPDPPPASAVRPAAPVPTVSAVRPGPRPQSRRLRRPDRWPQSCRLRRPDRWPQSRLRRSAAKTVSAGPVPIPRRLRRPQSAGFGGQTGSQSRRLWTGPNPKPGPSLARGPAASVFQPAGLSQWWMALMSRIGVGDPEQL